MTNSRAYETQCDGTRITSSSVRVCTGLGTCPHHDNEFVGEGWFLQNEESDLALSSAVQHPTGNIEMLSGKGLVTV